jgi:hypothetical protein
VSTRTYGIGLSVLALVVSFAAVFGVGSKVAVRDDQPAPSTPPSATAPSSRPTADSPSDPTAEPIDPPDTIHIRSGDLDQNHVEQRPGVTVWRAESNLGRPVWVCIQVRPPLRVVGWAPAPGDANTYCRQLDGDSAQDFDIQVATS